MGAAIIYVCYAIVCIFCSICNTNMSTLNVHIPYICIPMLYYADKSKSIYSLCSEEIFFVSNWSCKFYYEQANGKKSKFIRDSSALLECLFCCYGLSSIIRCNRILL